MKVVVRSSSLLFTLLSIILHVPIQRVKRSTAGDESAAGKDSKRVTENQYRIWPGLREDEAVMIGGERRDIPR